MNRILDKALTEALKGDQGYLAEFGVERLMIAGTGIPPAGFEWEERLTITGDGTASLLTRRSIADASSEPIGSFRDSCNAETVRNLIRLVQESRLDELPRCRLEPREKQLRITAVIGGICQQATLGTSDPEAAQPLKPLLQELDRLAYGARAGSLATLQLRLDMPINTRAAKVRMPVTLSFQNAGEAGYWLTHPGALQRSVGWEHCGLVYGRRAEALPGHTPPPVELREAALEPARSEELDLLWVDAGSEVFHSFTGTLEFPQPGTYLARAVYSSYAGEDQVGGRPRLRGCAFSNEVEIQVR